MPQPAYVNAGTPGFATVSSNAVSGLTLAMPVGMTVGNFLLALGLTRPVGAATPSTGWNNDVISATGSGVWSLLTDQELSPGYGGHIALWGKHVTGGEGNLKILVTAVEAGGNGAAGGVVLEFSNVKFTGDTSYFGGVQVTGRGAASGAVFGQGVSQSAAAQLLLNVIGTNAGAGTLVSSGPTGESSGKWTPRFWATANLPRIAVWTSSDATVVGGAVSSGPAGNSPFNAVGFTLAPCGAAVVSIPKFHHYLMMANG